MAEPERLVLPARRDVRERPRVAWRKAVSQPVPRVVQVLRVAQAHRVVRLQVQLALLYGAADESELLQGQSLLRVQQVSRPAAPLQVQVQEPVPWVPPEQPPQALPVRLVLPLAQQEPQAHSVSRRLVPRSLVEVPQSQQVSSAQPSQQLPSPLFPLWQPLPLALRLRRLPESSCAPFQRRPQGSSSSASSSP